MAPWSGSPGEPLDKAFYSLADDFPGVLLLGLANAKVNGK